MSFKLRILRRLLGPITKDELSSLKRYPQVVMGLDDMSREDRLLVLKAILLWLE